MDRTLFVSSGRDLFTQSRLRAYRKCPRYHYLRFEAGIIPAESKKALRMGSAFHLGQEELAKIPAGCDEKIREELTQNAILAALVDYNEGPPGYVTAEEWVIEREIVGRMLQGYSWRWSNEHIAILSAEHVFKQPIRNVETNQPMYKLFNSPGKPPSRVQLWRSGMIDKIVKVPDGRTAILEHKTTGDSIKPESDYWMQAKMSSQVTFYFKAATDDPAITTPDTIYYDVIRKPAIEPSKLTLQEMKDFLGISTKKGKKSVVKADPAKLHKYCGEPFEVVIDGHLDEKDPDNNLINSITVDGAKVEMVKASSTSEQMTMRETPTMFGARLMEDMLNRPDMYFSREEIPRLTDDILEFEADTHQTVEMILHCQRVGHWPRNTDSCTSPFRCEFFNICSNNVQVALDGDAPKGYSRLSYVHPELEHAGTNK